jgi:hypothetical protein
MSPDYIIVETTGMADPGPVAQTFFLDDEFKDRFPLDAIITLVDARHIEKHLDEMQEPGEQVAFADVILLNKTDLVGAAELERIERRIRAINSTAKLHRTQQANVPIATYSTSARSISNERSPSMPTSCSRNIRSSGPVRIDCPPDVMRCASVMHTMRTIIMTMHTTTTCITITVMIITTTAITRMPMRAGSAWCYCRSRRPTPPRSMRPSKRRCACSPKTRCRSLAKAELAPGKALYRIDVGHDGAHFDIAIENTGAYAIFCEHAPAEFNLRITGAQPVAERSFASHHHDEEISSIGLTDERPLDAKK